MGSPVVDHDAARVAHAPWGGIRQPVDPPKGRTVPQMKIRHRVQGQGSPFLLVQIPATH
jgi:hypothetical protein